MAFVVNANFQTHNTARVYRRPDPADNFTWLPVADIRSPVPEKPYVKSPRPFVFENKSYIVFTLQPHPTLQDNAEVWISDINSNPDDRFYRRVSEDTTGNRFDAEPFTTTSRPIIYYCEITATQQIILHRAQTGLVTAPVARLGVTGD